MERIPPLKRMALVLDTPVEKGETVGNQVVFPLKLLHQLRGLINTGDLVFLGGRWQRVTSRSDVDTIVSPFYAGERFVGVLVKIESIAEYGRELLVPYVYGEQVLLPNVLVPYVLRLYNELGVDVRRKKDLVGRYIAVVGDGVFVRYRVEGFTNGKFLVLNGVVPFVSPYITVYEEGTSLKELEPLGEYREEVFRQEVNVENVLPDLVKKGYVEILNTQARYLDPITCTSCGYSVRRRTLNGRCPRCGSRLEVRGEGLKTMTLESFFG